MDGLVEYNVSDLVAQLRTIASKTTDPSVIIERMRAPARRLASAKHWIEPGFYQCDPVQGFGAHLLHEEPDHSLAVMVLAWLPSRGVPPHDHGTWAVVTGIEGPETNIFWTRRDDGSRPEYCDIVERERQVVSAGAQVTLLPDEIHSVVNESDKVTLSLHIYGRHINHTARSQYCPITQVRRPLVVTMQH